MDLLAGRFELCHLVGLSGMAEVWAARDIDTGWDVAVKSVRGAPDSTAAQRLRREASVTASIDHPGVVGVRGVGDDDGRTFVVMDLLPGRDMASLLADGPLPLPRALSLLAGVGEALRAVHRTGVVHGDIKPANVMVTGEQATLIDFGIATDPSGWGGRNSYGTTATMAPEQIRDEPLTSATDMYSLGALAFAALTGRSMFRHDSPQVMLHHHAHTTPPRLSEVAVGVPARLDALVADLLAKDPAGRPSVAQVCEALSALLGAPEVRLQSAPLAATRVEPLLMLDPAGTQPMVTAGSEGLPTAA